MSRIQPTAPLAASSPPGSPLQALARLKAALAAARSDQESNYRVTPTGLWTCSDLDEVFDLFVQIDIGQYKRLVDLGSGDGRVVCLASYFTRAAGLEADPGLVDQSQRLAAGLGLERAEFRRVDLRGADLSPYDLLYIFPDKPLDWLEQMPRHAWQGKLMVYGTAFQPKGLNHLATLYAGATMCTLWCR